MNPGSLLLKLRQCSVQEQAMRQKFNAPALSESQARQVEIDTLEALYELDDCEGKDNRNLRLSAQMLLGVLKP